MESNLPGSQTVFEQARGVLAERLDVDPDTAAHILDRVAQREGISAVEIAANVVASCTGEACLPRDLYAKDHGYESAA
jgi:hypothetical protein